jgi:hypothetical protein
LQCVLNIFTKTTTPLICVLKYFPQYMQLLPMVIMYSVLLSVAGHHHVILKLIHLHCEQNSWAHIFELVHYAYWSLSRLCDHYCVLYCLSGVIDILFGISYKTFRCFQYLRYYIFIHVLGVYSRYQIVNIKYKQNAICWTKYPFETNLTKYYLCVIHAEIPTK